MEPQNPAIRVDGLRKSYEKLDVLKGVDFTVAAGSIFALLGSNGAGKTTVVRILSTLLKPDGGTATVGGYDVVSQPARVRESISLTGQFAAVDEILTGRENLVMIGRLRRSTRDAKGSNMLAVLSPRRREREDEFVGQSLFEVDGVRPSPPGPTKRLGRGRLR